MENVSCRDGRGECGGERDDEFSHERVDECVSPEIKVTRHRTLNALKSNAHHVCVPCEVRGGQQGS